MRVEDVVAIYIYMTPVKWSISNANNGFVFVNCVVSQILRMETNTLK